MSVAPEIVYPYTKLVQIGGDLTDISQKLAADDGAAYDVAGLDDPAQHPIKDAIGDFREEWEASVRKLGKNIGSSGELSTQIGTTVGAFDQQVADGLRPATAPSNAG